MVSLPIEVVILSVVVSGITQVLKYVSGKFKVDWDAEVAQITAAVIASALSLLSGAHLPLGIGAILVSVVSQAGPGLTAVLIAGGSYVAHDLAGILQSLLQVLQARLPARK